VLEGFNAAYTGNTGSGGSTPTFNGYDTETLLYVDSQTRNRIGSFLSDYASDLTGNAKVTSSAFLETESQGTDLNDTSVAYKRITTISSTLRFLVGSDSLDITFRNECKYQRQAGGNVLQNSFLSRVSIAGPRPGTFYANLGFTTVGDVFGEPFTINNSVVTTSKDTSDLTPTTFPIEIHAKGLGWGVNNGAYEYWELKVQVHGVFGEDLSDFMMGPLGGIEPNLP